MIDVLFIIPNNSKNIYQELSNKYSAIETPTWALLLAEACRAKNFKVSILDTLAENLDDEKSFEKIKKLNPKLILFVAYGQNVNAGTTNMSGVVRLARIIKGKGIETPIGVVGSHVQALPTQTLKQEKELDFVFTNEGVYSLQNLLKNKSISITEFKSLRGIAYRDETNKIIMNPPEKIVPQSRLDYDLPGYAWDLLPYKKKPFDLYRAPMWHAEYNEKFRTPYAAIQTSLGCQFSCEFCMINIINRNDNDEIGVASNYSGMRFWSTEFIIKEFDKLFNYGVKTIKITDEMFLLNPKFYIPLCKELAKRNLNDEFKMWAYSRIDTVKRPEVLDVVRKAGIKWLCLGIESGDKKVRLEVAKGKFEDVNVREVIEKIHNANIEVLANYIFGLPGDTMETMKKTLDMSIDLCTSGWNGYAAMALPGSSLYKKAIEESYPLPKNYEDFSFHSYNTIPMPTQSLEAWEILKFRDDAFTKYFKNTNVLNRIKKKFGILAINNIENMLKIKLKRKIVENKNS